MKRFVSILTAMLLALAVGLTAAGCASNKGGSSASSGRLSVYVPDGAPALALAKLMVSDDEAAKKLDIKVVNADSIGSFVLQETGDIVVLPVTAAAKLAGTGDKYKLAAVLTHGNLFLVTKNEAVPEAGQSFDLSSLKGKKVGCIQLASVPGLTLRAALKKANIGFDLDGQGGADKVHLSAVDPTSIPGALSATGSGAAIDYALAAEPQVSNLASKGINTVAPLQSYFGDGNGFPQAVMLVKNSIAADAAFISALISELKEAATWVVNNSAAAVDAINSHFAAEGASTLSREMPASAVTGSNIRVGTAAEEKTAVLEYIESILALGVDPAPTALPSDSFFLGAATDNGNGETDNDKTQGDFYG